MAEILYSPDHIGGIHKCWRELPGGVLKDAGNYEYYPKAIDGTVVQCSCGNVYKAKHTGYASLGCKYEQLGWWEARKYRKNAGKW